MRILQNLAVYSHERRIKNASRRDDDLVCGVAVKLAWKLRGLDANARQKLDETDAGIRERLLKPIEYGTRQSQSSALTARPVCSEESRSARADAESAESP